MDFSNLRFILCLFIINFLKFTSSAPQPQHGQRPVPGDYSVTHLDIRDAILSLVSVLRDQMDKLERHETRERQLGEQLTKSIGSLEKRGRGEERNFENIANYISRIDEKTKFIQATLEKQSEDRRLEHEVRGGDLASIKKLISETGRGGIPEAFERKFDVLSERVNSLKEAGELNSKKFDSLMELWKSSTSSGGGDLSDTIVQELTEIKEALARTAEMETRLLSRGSSGAGESEWQSELMESMDSQRKQLAFLEEEIGKALGLLGDMTKSASGLQGVLTELEGDTKKGFEVLGSHVGAMRDEASGEMGDKLSHVQEMLKSGQKHLEGKVREAETAVENLHTRLESGFGHLATELKGLSNVEAVLLDTGDSVLDTKRRLEYGVQQIMGELNAQLSHHTSKLNDSLQQRFDNLANSVLVQQSIALSNLTSKMDEEIGQVWRQIGILYHQMSRSVNLLDEIHSQTSKYVNNSLDTMSSMDGKVGQITNRMGEVDENLNYLLGRMSLVVGEFNEIKGGLGNALNSLKESISEIELKPSIDPENEGEVETKGNELE